MTKHRSGPECGALASGLLVEAQVNRNSFQVALRESSVNVLRGRNSVRVGASRRLRKGGLRFRQSEQIPIVHEECRRGIAAPNVRGQERVEVQDLVTRLDFQSAQRVVKAAAHRGGKRTAAARK